MKKLLFFLLFSISLVAQIPAGYYDSTNGLTGYKLKSELHHIISNKIISWNYGELGSFYPQTDADKYYENDNSVLDIYSENPTGPDAYEYDFTQNISSASAEGQGWNKEHMMPQSTFYSEYPMVSDLNFIVPADARINQLRSNYPYGVGGKTVYHSFTNGSEVASNATPDAVYTGRVYEPIDEFKGDVARSILYFAVRYESKLSGFKIVTNADPKKDQSPLDGTEERAYDSSFINLMKVWNQLDPVSQREIDRNNAIYKIQKNRNPFIDHPEWVNLIWDQTLSTTTPQVPTTLTASKVSAYFVNLNWVAPSDPSIIGYKIFKDGVLVGSSSTNSFTVDHLNPSTNYNFTVKAYNNAYEESAETNILPVQTYDTDIYAKDLMITKYLEGTYDNKAIEITNLTGHAVNLEDYNLSIQFEGSTSYYFPASLELEGVAANNETFVVLNPRAAFSCFKNDDAKFQSAAPQMTFNGSNYVELRYKSNTVDALGSKDINNYNDLGNVSLYRLNSVKQPSDLFNINEWEKHPVNFCTDLGTLAVKNLSNSPDIRIKIYPNPVSGGKIYFQSATLNQIKIVQIIDASGREILKENMPFRRKNFIDVSRLSKGIYFLKADNQNFKILIN